MGAQRDALGTRPRARRVRSIKTETPAEMSCSEAVAWPPSRPGSRQAQVTAATGRDAVSIGHPRPREPPVLPPTPEAQPPNHRTRALPQRKVQTRTRVFTPTMDGTKRGKRRKTQVRFRAHRSYAGARDSSGASETPPPAPAHVTRTLQNRESLRLFLNTWLLSLPAD